MAPTITVKCLQCGKSTTVSAAAAGKKGKCPVCGKIINIPDPKAKTDTLIVNEDISSAEVKKAAHALANGPGLREKKKRGFFARLFGK